ncbi:MAG: ATP-dependent DNA helicase RecQ [SAR324 cluster bacterium]|nr:ATP-dependent DNA helicase RecQ [SAR324 cluster bacterium]
MNFENLQQILFDWPNSQISQANEADSLLERIRQILLKIQQNPEINTGKDLIPLIRQYLYQESYIRGQTLELRVPLQNGWPSIHDWEQHHVSTYQILSHQALLLKTKDWLPTWLDPREGEVFKDALEGKQVRRNHNCKADPFIADATGYGEYSSPGQREAIRAAFLMKAGHTLMVNLPTGSGKSLVAQAPALVNPQAGNMTLFVVPTIALALDQERQMKIYFETIKHDLKDCPMAWHGGTSPADRQIIRQRMHNGTQSILFTNPESLTETLLSIAFEVASKGWLRYLVIDEAHLVTRWGDEFRPAFQTLAGFRNALLRVCPRERFRTLLLSATFTTETLDTLAQLFGPPDKVEMVAAVHLRPEPQYWFYKANSKEDKQTKVLEVLRHAPRPFILYLTTPEEAHEWYGLLSTKAHLKRIACFHGKTGDSDRESVIRKWAHNELDGIVATSAFGLGVDKSDVRTILHATIPESLDRFYQEVGRGGRDGKASISMLLYVDEDWGLPESLANPKLISDELGFDRWKAIYESRTQIEGSDLLKINMEAIPPHLKQSSDFNVKWNMRTLQLMARAGLLELDIEHNQTQVSPENLDAENVPSSLLTALATVRIRILDHGHLLKDHWENRMGESRRKTWASSDYSLKLLKSILLENKEVSRALADLYHVSSGKWYVGVVQACGGCPADRFDQMKVLDYNIPYPVPLMNPQKADPVRWREMFPWLDPRLVWVFYRSDLPINTLASQLRTFVLWLIQECGFKELVLKISPSLNGLLNFHTLYKKSKDGILIHREWNQWEEEPYSPLARITLMDGMLQPDEWEKIRMLDRPYHILLLPDHSIDPENPTRKIADTVNPSAVLDQLLPGILQ